MWARLLFVGGLRRRRRRRMFSCAAHSSRVFASLSARPRSHRYAAVPRTRSSGRRSRWSLSLSSIIIRLSAKLAVRGREAGIDIRRAHASGYSRHVRWNEAGLGVCVCVVFVSFYMCGVLTSIETCVCVCNAHARARGLCVYNAHRVI